jgi:DNA-binding beta-propeller fold protein YncE
VAHPQIAAFARLAGENSKPNRLIAGQQTRLSRTMHDIRYDPVHDEMLVTNPFSRAILVFRGGADAEEAPIRIIQGPNTKLRGSDRLDVDPVHNEIYIPNGRDILVFPREGRGDIPPTRIITGPDITSDDVGTLAVDPVNNVFVTAKDVVRAGGAQRSRLLIYSRTANGDSRPLRIIAGPKTEILRINQLQIYAPTGRIIAAMPGAYDMQEPEGVFIGIWNITDNGDVAPRWKIAGPRSTMMKPRGVAINPKDKEILVGDMRMNAVLTYYLPEIF